MISESSKRHSKFLSLIFILKCLSKATCFKEQTCGLWVIGGLSLSMFFVINDFCAKQLLQNRKGQNTISNKELRK